MSILRKLIIGFTHSMKELCRNVQPDSKIYMEVKGLIIARTTFKEKNNVEGFTLPHFKTL